MNNYTDSTGNTKSKDDARYEIFDFLTGDYHNNNYEFSKASDHVRFDWEVNRDYKLLSITHYSELEYHGSEISYNMKQFNGSWFHPSQYFGVNKSKKEINDIVNVHKVRNWPVYSNRYFSGDFNVVLKNLLGRRQNIVAGNIDLCSEPPTAAKVTSRAMNIFEKYSNEKNRIAVTVSIDNPWRKRARKDTEYKPEDFVQYLNEFYPEWDKKWYMPKEYHKYKNKKSKMVIFFLEKI